MRGSLLRRLWDMTTNIKRLTTGPAFSNDTLKLIV